MVTVQKFCIECPPYILFQVPRKPMTLSLERMGALSVTKPHIPPRLPESILNVLPMYRYIFSGKQLSQTILCSKYDFEIVQVQNLEKFFRKSTAMVKVFRYLTILVVATHKYSIKFYSVLYFPKFTKIHLCRSPFLIKMQAITSNFIMKRYLLKKAI